jgi:hypothetical protein
MRASRSLLAGDRLAGLASREVRSRPSTQELEELEAYRGKLRSERSPEDRLAHRATILSENVRSRGFGSVAFDGDDAVEEAEHDRLSVKSEESETGSDVGVAGRHASEQVGDFVDVTKLSAASRRSAAPHIYNIFEQIFCDTEVAHQRQAIPDLPDAVRASMRASGVDLEEELGLTGTRAEVVMTIEESWHALTAGTGIANRLEKQLVADLSIALRIDKARIHVTNVRAADSGGSRVIAELQFLPASDSEPTALEIAEALSLQAGTPKSMLHAMNSTRHASDVRFREVQPAVVKGLQGGQSGPYEALLRGGVVVDDRGVRPTLSAVHGVASSQLKAGERSAGGHRDTTSIQAQQRDAHALSMVEAARRQQEGFWVDVDRGVYQPVQTNKYGTFHSARGKKVRHSHPPQYRAPMQCVPVTAPPRAEDA